MTPFLTISAVLICVVAQGQANSIGPNGQIGALENSETVYTDELRITEPGTYENIVVDRGWKSGNAVRIKADDVHLRNVTVMNVGRGNAIGVFGKNVRIDRCKIRYCLAGTFDDQVDSHGISGDWGDVRISNCDIGYTSGDSIQFDPSRRSRGRVEVQNCKLWTGPLPSDLAGFKKGEQPGEDGIDTKTKRPRDDPGRDRLVITNTLFQGWAQPGRISHVTGVNIKEQVDCSIENCVFNQCDVALRLRGASGTDRGGARVTLNGIAIFHTSTAVRTEQHVELSINDLRLGPNIKRPFHHTQGGPPKGFTNTKQGTASDLEEVIKNGVAKRE
ncbi:MAG: hypothetical protein AAGG48_25515 [Planctomycetota bacterium]